MTKTILSPRSNLVDLATYRVAYRTMLAYAHQALTELGASPATLASPTLREGAVEAARAAVRRPNALATMAAVRAWVDAGGGPMPPTLRLEENPENRFYFALVSS